MWFGFVIFSFRFLAAKWDTTCAILWSRCAIFFEMLSWKVKKLGWLLYHLPWWGFSTYIGGLSTKDTETIWLCILTPMCSDLPLLWCFSLSWGAGSEPACKYSVFYSQNWKACFGTLKEKDDSVVTRREAVFLEVVLLFLLLPRTSR